MRQFALSSPRGNPEEELQKAVASMLRWRLPPEIWWTASLSGVRLSPPVAYRAKLAGMEKGAPDVSFILPDGSTVYVELKAPLGQLSPEQKRVRDLTAPRNAFAVCRSLQEVETAVNRWLAPFGLQLRGRIAA